MDAEVPRPDHSIALPPDSIVIMYTDGLVERRGEPLDRGLDSLAVTACRHAGEPVAGLCSALAHHYPSDGHDDMAALVLRTPAPGGATDHTRTSSSCF